MPDELLLGKHALIMGASADVAEPIALALARAGADVALTTATNDADEAFALRRITRGVKALGRQSLNESVDMSIGTGVQIAVRQVAKELGGIDILVAGPDLRIDKPTDRLTDADWSRLLNTNLSAVYFACRSAYREMSGRNMEQGTGNKGWIMVLLPEVGDDAEAGYVAARAGVEALVAALTRQWAADGVMVTGVSLHNAPEGVLEAL